MSLGQGIFDWNGERCACTDQLSVSLDHSATAAPTTAASSSPRFEDPDVFARVTQLVANLRVSTDERQDLTQIALLHFWQELQEHPGQRLSWYLQSCRFHLIDKLRSGRSIDAIKRSHLRADLYSESDEDWEIENLNAPAEEEVLSVVIANEVFTMLAQRLEGTQLAVFVDLFHGFGVQEISRRMGISHQAVGGARRNIARLAIRIGIAREFRQKNPRRSFGCESVA